MALTGSYNSKSRGRETLQTSPYTPPSLPEVVNESKVVFSEGPLAMNIEKGLSRQATFESNDERVGSQHNTSNFFFFNNNFVPPTTSFSQLSTGTSQGKKNHQPVELNYDNAVKKLKYEASNIFEGDEVNKENNFEAGNSLTGDEFFNMTPLLGKKPSFRLSQMSDDFPATTPQWNFSLTFSQEK